MHSKAWTGRGPGGRGFLRACKNPRQPRTSHGRHPFTQADGRERKFHFTLCRIKRKCGNDIKDFLSHSATIQGEWSSKGSVSFPLKREPKGGWEDRKREDVSESEVKSVMNVCADRELRRYQSGSCKFLPGSVGENCTFLGWYCLKNRAVIYLICINFCAI